MSITLPTVLTQGESTTAGTTRATASFTMPSSGMVLAVWTIHTSGGTLSNPSLTDNVGGTWGNYTDGTTAANGIITTNTSRIKVFRCTAMVAGTATLTLDCGANSHDGWTWHILHYSDCLNQNAIQVVNATGTDNAPTATLAAMQAANGTLGFCGSNGGTLAVGAGFTISGVVQTSTSGIRGMAEAQTGNDTGVDAVATGAPQWRMLAAEVAPTAGTVVGTSTRLRSARRRR